MSTFKKERMEKRKKDRKKEIERKNKRKKEKAASPSDSIKEMLLKLPISQMQIAFD